jgi:predicted HD superfamily hydrolase involved in NAD metabolism
MRESVLAWLAENVSEHRLQHILGVEQLSRDLARHYGVNPEQAAMAGLMHDLAKFFPPERLLRMAGERNIIVDEICYAHPHLLHGEISAVVALEEFGVTEPEVLAAIRNHTLGSPAMTDLSCIVFVADAIEPNRGQTPELEALRHISWQNLYKTVQQTCDYSLQYLLSHHRTIHPRMILTRNWALHKARQATKEKLNAPSHNDS